MKRRINRIPLLIAASFGGGMIFREVSHDGGVGPAFAVLIVLVVALAFLQVWVERGFAESAEAKT